MMWEGGGVCVCVGGGGVNFSRCSLSSFTKSSAFFFFFFLFFFCFFFCFFFLFSFFVMLRSGLWAAFGEEVHSG